ncbi:prephenate dehydrogenase [Rhodococcus sp. 05-2255-3B1]|uniref:prephenate dehydrogenase n=1 Tax=unclassified Rhodococcus (in: high G+C Gram-positive bacteria) TaxID=192944 RepID=UPI000B9C23D8|nr:prephenate dehydrogenase [Rhodococcus sp. 06-469-3-2]OZE11211.1 prephenate dehydrogenase [Rhodococcus sp. 05-2255-3C]OZE14438.1 prephenate dehydrogenase [Rhodococcus sp. 05-2255-3B1]OZE24920.1 prephenate dehydrogenase [Rhodococcus sp. 05-2255-2A2]
MCQSDRVTSSSVCVLGLGLIGGSILRAAHDAGRPVWGWNRSADAIAGAVADGYDVGTDLVAALSRAAAQDALIVVAVPMPAVESILTAVAEHAPTAPLTDVVSVKAEMAAAVEAQGLQARYVGGHPMAGTNHSGWSATDPTLFADAVWVVSTDPGVDADVWVRVARLALDCGSVVVPAESVEHDRAVARISHLPHVLAETLAIVGAAGGPLALGLAAGSFRDGTRVASSSPNLVRAMTEGNAAALRTALDEALDALTAAREELDEGSTKSLVEAGNTARLQYEQHQRFEITDVTPGEPGWREKLQDAGRRGGVVRQIRSASPG